MNLIQFSNIISKIERDWNVSLDDVEIVAYDFTNTVKAKGILYLPLQNTIVLTNVPWTACEVFGIEGHEESRGITWDYYSLEDVDND